MRLTVLLGIAAALMALAAVGYANASPADQVPALLAVLAIIILAELPAVFFRMRGAWPLAT